MRTLAISAAIAGSILASPAALAQSADSIAVANPLTAIVGGIADLVTATAPAANAAQEPSRPQDLRAGEIVPQRRGERFALHGQRDERGYVQTTVKGRTVLVDPRTRRIVEVLD
jgi:hypothetical protein